MTGDLDRRGKGEAMKNASRRGMILIEHEEYEITTSATAHIMLHLQLGIRQTVEFDSPFAKEYDEMQYILQGFYSKTCNEVVGFMLPVVPICMPQWISTERRSARRSLLHREKQQIGGGAVDGELAGQSEEMGRALAKFLSSPLHSVKHQLGDLFR
nr:testis-expressed sequence 10 protein homolog [Ipomoea batatas]